MASACKSKDGSVGGAVVLDNKPVGEPELPVLGILRLAKSLECSPKDAVLAIQDWSPVTVVSADRALERG